MTEYICIIVPKEDGIMVRYTIKLKKAVVGERTIDRVKKKFIEEGFEEVLERRASNQNRLRSLVFATAFL